MIVLDATTDSIQIKLSSSVAANNLEWTSSYLDVTTTTYTPGSSGGTVSGTSYVTAISAPSGSHQIQAKQITVFNADTSPATVWIVKTTSGPNYRVLCKVTLQVNYTLQYSDGEGFSILSGNGGICHNNTPIMSVSVGSQSISSGTLSFANSNNVTIEMTNSSQISMSYDNRTITASFWQAPWFQLNANAANTAVTAGANLSLNRFFLPYDINVTRIDFLAHVSAGGSQRGSISYNAGIYTQNGQTLSLYTSTRYAELWTATGATNNTSSYLGISGTRFRSLSIPSAWGLTPGDYWMGVFVSATGTAGSLPTVSMFGQSSVQVLGVPGGNNDVVGKMGLFSTQTAAFPVSIVLSQDIIYASSGTLASQIMRQPFFRFFGSY